MHGMLSICIDTPEANCMTRFGIVHLVLQLLPVLNMFFLLCTAAGAALYASDEEDKRLEQEEVHAAGQAYRDDPT